MDNATHLGLDVHRETIAVAILRPGQHEPDERTIPNTPESLRALVASGAVAAIVRTIFAQPDHPSALSQLTRVADGLRPRFSSAAELLESAAEDVLAHFHFPEEHRRRLHSTNPLERLHKEVKRRTAVVGIFPDRAVVELGTTAILDLLGVVVVRRSPYPRSGCRAEAAAADAAFAACFPVLLGLRSGPGELLKSTYTRLVVRIVCNQLATLPGPAFPASSQPSR
jgi:hypothetical protein